ncbi:MAG: SRPBCC family protein [Hyphomicrobiaceae bacterium]|nr:SRPBCC family protein [Hyphomicrobiaceae bacterium]
MFDIIVSTLIALMAGAAVLFLYVVRRPDRPIVRSALIDAPPEHIFHHINDLRAFNRWNPFDEPSPNGPDAYSGAASGPGQRYDFDTKSSGSGHIEIARSDLPRRVEMRLVMVKPLACDNRVMFTLEPEGRGTRVTWSMTGTAGPFAKVMGFLMCGEQMCCNAFDKGLASLKAIVERQAARDALRAVG